MKITQSGMLLFLALLPLHLNGMMQNEKNEGKLKLDVMPPDSSNGKKIGSYFFTNHALARMRDREINTEDALWVLGHGNRYYNYHNGKASYLCVDTKKRIGIILSQKTNTVITVYSNMSQKKLEKWLEKRDQKSKKPKAPTQSKSISKEEEEEQYDEFEAFK